MRTQQLAQKNFQLLRITLLVVVLAWVALSQRPTFAQEIVQHGDYCAQVTEIPSGECQALLTLYEATGGYDWINQDGWLETGRSPCTWIGVACTEGHVTIIHLTNNQLIGTIPAELENLPLEFLDLSYNLLNGSIPIELANLVNLHTLHLNINVLTGSIPAELGNLTYLRSLRLDHNFLTGPIPPELGNLTSLEMLHLGNNQLSGWIPAEIGNLVNLRKFSVGLYEVGSEEYQLPMSGLINELKPVWEPYSQAVLEPLGAYVPGNQLGGTIPSELGNLNQIQEMDLGWNHFGGSIPSELGQLTTIKRLSLSHNQLDGLIPAELGNLTHLEYLDLASNDLEGYLPESFCQLDNLEEGDFRHNHLAGTTVLSECEAQPFLLAHNRPKNAIPPLLWVVWGILFCGIVVNLRKSPRSNSR